MVRVCDDCFESASQVMDGKQRTTSRLKAQASLALSRPTMAERPAGAARGLPPRPPLASVEDEAAALAGEALGVAADGSAAVGMGRLTPTAAGAATAAAVAAISAAASATLAQQALHAWYGPLATLAAPRGDESALYTWCDDADGTKIELHSAMPSAATLEDVLLAEITPPFIARDPVPCPLRLDAVFPGCTRSGGVISAATVNDALKWLVEASASLFDDAEGRHVVVGLDCESDPKGRLALVQLCVLER